MTAQSQHDATVRATRLELARVGRRYIPPTLVATALAALITFAPSVSPTQAKPDSLLGASSTPGGSSGGTPGVPLPGATSAPGGGVGPGSQLPGTTGGFTTGGGPTGGGPTGPPSNGTSQTLAGVTCSRGVLQTPWSAYGPPCMTKWAGSNGGATARGVTATTITLTYRQGSDTQSQAVGAYVDGFPTDAQYLADLNSYLPLFNKYFELYGRKVVLKPFNAQGNWLLETEGQNYAGAQADAAAAANAGAFADVSNFAEATQVYSQYLAEEHVITTGGVDFADSFYRQFAPYAYSFLPSADSLGGFFSNLVCQKLNGLPAVYAGSPTLKQGKRVFGLAYVRSLPAFAAMADAVQKGVKRCGVTFKVNAGYEGNPATEGSDAANISAQMRTAGVTTIVCVCDATMMQNLASNNDQQQYFPEWVVTNSGDSPGRGQSTTQWAHAMAFGSTYQAFGGPIPQDKTEAYRSFRLAAPGKTPVTKVYPMAYYTLLHVFAGLQAAGPNLNAQNFQRGLFGLPPTRLGDDGVWKYNQYTPPSNTQLTYWDPQATSKFDGKQGAWRTCDAGAWVDFLSTRGWGAAGTQPRCFGR